MGRYRALGHLRNFLEAHPDMFKVVPCEGNRYTVEFIKDSGEESLDEDSENEAGNEDEEEVEENDEFTWREFQGGRGRGGCASRGRSGASRVLRAKRWAASGGS